MVHRPPLPIHILMNTVYKHGHVQATVGGGGGGGSAVLEDVVSPFSIDVDNGSSSNTASVTAGTRNVLTWAGTRLRTSNVGPNFEDVLFGLSISAGIVTATRQGTTSSATVGGTNIPFDPSVVKQVQRGQITVTGVGIVDNDSTEVFDAVLDNSIAVFIGQSMNIATGQGDMDHTALRVTTVGSDGSVQVRAHRRAGHGTRAPVAYYQFIEFEDGYLDSLQKFDITLTNTVATDQALGTTVDTDRAVMFYGGYDTTNATCTVGLKDADNVTAQRLGGSGTTVVSGAVAEFPDGAINSITRIYDKQLNESSNPTNHALPSIDPDYSSITYLGVKATGLTGLNGNQMMVEGVITDGDNFDITRFGTTTTDIFANFEVVNYVQP